MPVFKVRFSVPESVMELGVDWVNGDSVDDLCNVLQNEAACYLQEIAVGSININYEDLIEVASKLRVV